MAADRLRPDEWMLPNRVGFPEWVYKTFNVDKYAESRTNAFIQQRLVRDFLQKVSPYRGMLLYHGLGSGKTCTAIAATEAYSHSGRKVVVMLPASLAQNYINELQSCGNLARWSAVTLDTEREEDARMLAVLKKAFHYSSEFLQKHARPDKEGAPTKYKVWMPWVPKVQGAAAGNAWAPAVPTSRLEPHRTRVRALDEDARAQVDRTLKHIMPHVYSFIKYNGLTQKMMETYTPRFFDQSIVVIDEAHNFISQATHPGTLNYRLYQALRGARDCRLILLSGTPAINNVLEIGTTLNLLRGDMRVLELEMPVSETFPTTDEIKARLQGRKLNAVTLDRYVDDVVTSPGEHRIRVALLPQGFVRSESDATRVISKTWGMSTDGFEAQLVQLFAPVAKSRTLHFNAFPAKYEDFNELFLDMSQRDKPKMREHDLFMRRSMGLVSYLQNVDDGTYPKVLPQRIVECPMTGHQFEAYEKNRKKEIEMEVKQEQRQALGTKDPFAKVSSVYRAFSRMTCNFAFPKELNRPFPRDMRAARKQMDVIDEDVAAGEAPAAVAVADAYERALEDALVRLRTRGDIYLSYDALAETHSPKMARALVDINESPGKVLLYSQFRTMEGIGIMRLVLAQAGWAEIEVAKTGNGQWRVFGPDNMPMEELFHPRYAGKRFVVFNSDREKTEVLMRIFNGQLHMLPPYLARQLAAHEYEKTEDNMYGDKCALMMVSQSGAEGISLKHVRRVLILEPFWNKVRIEQVIGRAARRFSHTDLPPEERDVEVRMYTAVFTPDQIAKSFTIQIHEEGISSDTHIASIAARKDGIIQEFLTALKRVAVDCAILAKTNKSDVACYQFPRGQPRADRAFVPDIVEDRARAAALGRRMVPADVQGRVVRHEGKKKVVLDDKLYDYDAYVHAKMLVDA